MTPIPSIQQAVWQAADQLMAQGIRPTVANVREVTRRGSAGTINDALKDWWQDLAERLSNRIPQPDVPQPVIDMTRELWAKSLAHGEQAFAALREECLAAARAATEEKQAALTALEQLRLQHQQLLEQHERLREAEKDLLTRLSAESAQRTEAENRWQQLQEKQSDLESARSQLEKELALLAAQYRHAEQQWHGEREQLSRQREEQAELSRALRLEQQTVLQATENRLTQTELKLHDAQAEARTLQQRLDALQQEMTRLRLQGPDGHSRRDTLKARLRRY
jgi:chromosome segregation ATPase